MRCIVVTPEKTVLDTDADFVVVPLFDGEYGVAPGHTPLVGRVGNGELRIRTSQETLRFFVSGGVVEVLDDVISVLPNVAIPRADLKPTELRAKLDTAMKLPKRTPEEADIHERDVARYRTQLRLAEK